MPATCVVTKRAFQTMRKICFEKNICVHPGKDGLPVAVRIELSQFSDQRFLSPEAVSCALRLQSYRDPLHTGNVQIITCKSNSKKGRGHFLAPALPNVQGGLVILRYSFS